MTLVTSSESQNPLFDTPADRTTAHNLAMLDLYQLHITDADGWTIRRWDEGQGDNVPSSLLGQEAAARWLRAVDSHVLRRLAFEYLDQPTLHRLTDSSIAEALAVMVGNGVLRVVPNDRLQSGLTHESTTVDKIIRKLRVTAHAFFFEGSRFRIIDAGSLGSLRASDDERYQVLAHDEAQAMLAKLVQWTWLSPDERAAIAQAVPLVPPLLQPAQTMGGVLLLRIVESVGSMDSARGTVASSPSQLARRQKDDAETHWIQIELINMEDQPVPNEAYKIELPDGEIREGRLDDKGRAYIGGLKVAGQCKVCFPEIDTKEWRAA